MAELSLDHVYVPPEFEASLPAPGVVLMHGLGADQYDLLPIVEMLPHQAQYVSVRAPFPAPMGGYAWFDPDRRDLAEAASFDAGFAALQQFLDEAREAYSMDPLFVAGFSMGGAMAVSSYLHRMTEFAGVAVLSGFMIGRVRMLDWAAPKGKPAFVGHGKSDEIVPIRRGRQVHASLIARGMKVTYREYPIGHSISPQEKADLATWLEGLI